MERESVVPSMPEVGGISESTSPPVRPLHYHGAGRELFEIFIVNVFFTILSLGVYSFWAKTRTRRYLLGQIELGGDRLSYHGTGRELLIGWLKALLAFGALVAAQIGITLVGDKQWTKLLATVVLYVGLGFLLPLARLGTMRYRLSRTSWRGIRFSFRGAYIPLFKLSLRGYLLTALTLGFYFPEFHRQLRAYVVGHSWWGSIPFRFEDADGQLLWRSYRNALLLTLGLAPLMFLWISFGPWGTVGGTIAFFLTFAGLGLFVLLAWVRYYAERQRFYWDHTRVGEARFTSSVTRDGLGRLYLGNLWRTLCTVGLGLPWVKVRTMRFDVETLALVGGQDFDQVVQESRSETSTGDELAGFLDVDAFSG